MFKFKRVFGSLSVLAVFATACSGGADPPSRSATAASEATTVGLNAVVSPDGLLRVGPPPDGTNITIKLVDPVLDEGPAVLVGAYELGPSGSTFDPPLPAHITLTEQAMDQGVAIFHERDDGSVEIVPFEFDDTGASFQITAFSTYRVSTLGPYEIILEGPSQGFVGEIVNVELSAKTTLYGYDHFRDLATILGNRSEFSLEGPLSMQGSGILCADEGLGIVSYEGEVRIDAELNSRTYTWSTRGDRALSLSHNLNCTRRIIIEPDDTRCVLKSSGEDATGCPDNLQVALSDNGDGTLDISVQLKEDVSAIWIFTAFTGERVFVAEYSDPSEDTGGYRFFDGPGLEQFTPEETPITRVERDGDRVWLRNWTVPSLDDGPLQLSKPAGITSGGRQVAADSLELSDLSVIMTQEGPEGEVQGVYSFFPGTISDAIASMLLETSGAEVD